MNINEILTAKLKLNESNPRYIRDDKFIKLKNSIKSFPKMLELRPIVVDKDMVVLGGNMRLRACIELGMDVVPVVIADELTEEQKREFIIKDNVGFGEWDWDTLANEWDSIELGEWGLDTIKIEENIEPNDSDDMYTSKVDTPIYEPKLENAPNIDDLLDTSKRDDFYKNIEKAIVSDKEKLFLRHCAERFLVFDYGLIAEYYAHANKPMQEIMENLALVIIDFEKAIELGYVKLSSSIAKQYSVEYEEEND